MGALPYEVAEIAFAVAGALAVLGALYLFGVRDWRCYGIALYGYPVITSIWTGSVSPFLLLAVAFAWRYRDLRIAAAVAAAAAMTIKLFLWPLLVWLVATRRYKTAALSIAVCAFSTFAAWLAIGFDGLSTYPEALRRLSELEAESSYSAQALLATGFGVPSGVAAAAVAISGLVLLGGCFLFARHGRHDHALGLAVAAALVMTPILWLHYLVLLLAPIAIARPRLSPAWFIPWALGFAQMPAWNDGDLIDLLAVWLTVGAVFTLTFVTLRQVRDVGLRRLPRGTGDSTGGAVSPTSV